MLTCINFINVDPTIIKAYYHVEPNHSMIPTGYKVVPYFCNQTYEYSNVYTSSNNISNPKTNLTTKVSAYKAFVLIPSF